MRAASPLAATLRDLFARQRRGMRLGLDTMRRLCAALGQPQRRGHAIMVAGTNGKGSTAALLAQALRQGGARCGLYSSPHLLRFGERIQIGGQPLNASAIVALYADVCRASRRAHVDPSFFEATTAMAFLAFAAARLDFCVLEVGLGGRLDATNVARRRLCLLTPIDYDHRAILGATLAAIAAEKAAILRPGVAAFSAVQRPAVAAVLRRRARALHCPLRTLEAEGAPPAGLAASTPAYLQNNARLAMAAAAHLGVDAAARRRACAQREWPGRYQWLTRKKGAPQIVLDGAHNPAGAAALVAALAADPRWQRRRRAVLLVAAVGDKEVGAMLRHWRRLQVPLLACGLRTPRGLGAADWAAHRTPFRASFAAAYAAAVGHVGPAGLVVACGSLYLVGEALAKLTGAACDPPVSG